MRTADDEAPANTLGNSPGAVTPIAPVPVETLDEDERAVSIDDAGWDDLLQNIGEGICTPFLGAGASVAWLPSAGDLAETWAQQYNYPLEDSKNLSRVAQFLATTRSPQFPKIQVQKRFDAVLTPEFHAENDVHALLAGFPLPVYITTNYDDLMVRALRAKNKSPRQELCRWNFLVKQHQPSIYDAEPDYQPSAKDPLVYHLHGAIQFPPSLVLTEDDYVDFLINMDEKLLPPRVQESFTGASILFLGYGLNDWNFKLLFRTMVTYMQKSMVQTHVSVQLVPLDRKVPQPKRMEALKYLDAYYTKLNIKVYWGTCRQFSEDLHARWQAQRGQSSMKSQAGTV
jgi:hypothetical protein